jgi:hypothetical protein
VLALQWQGGGVLVAFEEKYAVTPKKLLHKLPFFFIIVSNERRKKLHHGSCRAAAVAFPPQKLRGLSVFEDR